MLSTLLNKFTKFQKKYQALFQGANWRESDAGTVRWGLVPVCFVEARVATHIALLQTRANDWGTSYHTHSFTSDSHQRFVEIC